MMRRPVLLVLLGPTGVGKTALGIHLAVDFNIPIVSADSRQIYQNMPIGTGCPTREEQLKVKHYFIETKPLDTDFNAGAYERECTTLLENLAEQNSTSPFFAILLGGSMLYLDAVCKGLDDIPSIPAEIKHYLESTYKERGLKWLQDEVARVDEAYWQLVDKNNPARLMHCLEVCTLTGKPYSSFCNKEAAKRIERPWQAVKVGLYRERSELYERINRRVDEMVKMGLVDEARRLYERFGHKRTDPSFPNCLNAVGYRELFDFFDSKLSLTEAIDLIKQHSRNYAKRQMTWWRKQIDIHWIEANCDYEKIKLQISDFTAV